MTVRNHNLIPAQSLLSESICDFGPRLESLSIVEKVRPLKPSSTRDSSPAFVAVSAFLPRELSFAPHVQDRADRGERTSSAVARSLEAGLTWKIFSSGSTILF